MSINEYSKEELELLSYKDITDKLLDEFGAMSTQDLFKRITTLLDLPNNVFENKIGDYYMSLTTDKRFIQLDDGSWDLRNRHTSDKVIINVDEDDDSDLENEEDMDEISDGDDEAIETNFDDVDSDDDFDENDDLKDLVIMDEDELELEQ